MTIYVGKPPKTPCDHGGFSGRRQVIHPCRGLTEGQKQHTSEQEAPAIKHNYKTPACITFSANANHSTKIPIAAHVRMLIEELTHADEMLLFLSLDKKKTFYLTNDKFPEDESKFKEFF